MQSRPPSPSNPNRPDTPDEAHFRSLFPRWNRETGKHDLELDVGPRKFNTETDQYLTESDADAEPRLSGLRIIDMDHTHYLSETDTDTATSTLEADDEMTDRGVTATESETDYTDYDEPFPMFPVLEVNMDLVHGNNNE